MQELIEFIESIPEFTNQNNKLITTFETEDFVYLDAPFWAGGRITKVQIRIKEDREAIQIRGKFHCEEEYETLYEGFCKDVEFFKTIFLNLFGGDGGSELSDAEVTNQEFSNKFLD